MLQLSQTYSVAVLKAGPAYGSEIAAPIVWEHGRRNFELRADGLRSIVCRVIDDTDLCGIGIFNLDVDSTRRTLQADPGVQAGVFTFEVHPCRGFPGDALPQPSQ